MKKFYRLVAVLMTAGLIALLAACSSGGDSGDSHVHTFASVWSSDATYHWRAATCGDTTEIRDKAEHAFGEWITTKEAAEQTDGIREKSCSVCGFKVQDSIARTFTAQTAEVTLAELNLSSIMEGGVASSDETVATAVKTENGIKVTSVKSGTAVISISESSVRKATVNVTVSSGGAITKSVTAFGKTVITGTVTINGTAKVGQTLTASYTGGETLSYQWSANGTEIAGATQKTYKLTSGEFGKTITVTVAGTGDYTGSAVSAATSAVDYGATYTWTEKVKELSAGTDGTAGTSGKYVHFGDWPQTLAASGITFNAEPESNGYYVGSDGNYYAKCLENAYESSYKYLDGTTKVQQASAGSYKYFKVEPIKWRVLTDSYDYDGNAGTNTAKLLVAENILTGNIPYYKYDSSSNTRSIGSDTKIYSNNYKYSQVRAWLNGLDYYNDSKNTVTDYSGKGFLQAAFTTAARELIKTTTVDNREASTTDTGNNITKATSYACADTEDKVFLLSEQEATVTSYGFAAYNSSGTGNARIRITTDYARANHAYQNTAKAGYGGSWWLRSPNYFYSGCARYVSSVGRSNDSNDVDCTESGVVPALSISF